MKKMIVLVLTMMVLGGCAIALKPDFVEKANNDLGIKPVVYQRADWIQGVYGYPSFSEALTSKISIIRGALVCSDNKVVFLRFNKQLEKYVPIFELSYDEITNLTMARKGAGRRLVLHEKRNVYTIEIVKGAMIDREKTVMFHNFIANKLGMPLLPDEKNIEDKKDE